MMSDASKFPEMTAAELRDFRAKGHLSQRGLADRLGISVRTVEDWEGGRRSPPAYLRLALERVQQLLDQ